MYNSFFGALLFFIITPTGSNAQQPIPVLQEYKKAILQSLPDSIYVMADTSFAKAGTNRWLLGNHYRKEWLTAIRVPVVYLDTLFGGVTVTREGGGKQTRSLRLSLDTAQDREIIIRSIEKFPDKSLAPELTGGAISHYLKDQISTAHPFGALTVPPLAEAAEIYHTNPKIVFIPSSKRLAEYDSLYGNRLYLLEERSRSNWSETPFFGGAEKVISTGRLLERLMKNPNNKVDVPAFLRARLLDILIGDWDRHEDQWDWASFPVGEETIYRPIPKDRDQVFVQLDGVAPWIGTRKWLLRRVKHFDYTIQDLEGLTWQARHLDRFVLNALSWSHWEKEVLFVQSAWNEKVIREAVAKLPPEHYTISGPDIERKLVQRRLDLRRYARQFYLSLAKEIDWVGSDDHDKFIVELKNDSLLLVQQYCIKRQSATLVKERSFLAQETKEIRLYGLEDDDTFEVKGTGLPATKIRWIGGKGSDQHIDTRPLSNRIRMHVYDTAILNRKNTSAMKLHHHFDSMSHTYWYTAFDYNRLIPLFLPNFNVEDGVAIGAGLRWQRMAWGHAGFAQEHIVGARYAFRTGAYEFSYAGLFKKVIRRWDIAVNSAVRHPAYILNFYGLGNNTERRINHRNFYNVLVRQIQARIALQQTFQQKHTVKLATEILSGKVEPNESRFVKLNNPLFDSTDFTQKTWLGLSGTYLLSTKNNNFFPTSGIHWLKFFQYNRMAGNARSFLNIASEFSFYFPVGPLTVASRLGGAMVWGRPQFFQNAHLGGLENLRGYRRTRFSGKSVFYNNQELRLPVADINGYIFRGRAGILAFSDQGRVWYPGEKSNRWHWGYGGGVWFIPYGRYSFTFTYTQSREDRLIVFRSGFLF